MARLIGFSKSPTAQSLMPSLGAVGLRQIAPFLNQRRDSMLTLRMGWAGLPQIGVSAKEAIRKA